MVVLCMTPKVESFTGGTGSRFDFFLFHLSLLQLLQIQVGVIRDSLFLLNVPLTSTLCIQG